MYHLWHIWHLPRVTYLWIVTSEQMVRQLDSRF